MFRTLETGALFPFCTNRCLTWSRAEATVSEGKRVHQSDLTVPCDSEDSFSLSSLFPSLAHSFPRVSSPKFEAHTTGQTFLAPFHCSFLPGASMRNSACGKGHEKGGSAHAKVGLNLRSPPGNSRASTPKTRVCLFYGFVLSPSSVHGISQASILEWVAISFSRGSKCPLKRSQWHPTPLLLPGKSHGQRSLVGYSPWGREESDMTEWLHFHFSLSCIWEGKGNPF